ncbi:MAG: DUF427 domain-containing protein [Solirubrobacteraceae bacterium]
MGLMTGSGPFGPTPAGLFNFEPPAPGSALYLDPSSKRVRVILGGETIADSRSAFLLHESGHQPVYYFPPEDVAMSLCEPTDHHTVCPKKGEASYYTLRAGSEVVENGAWCYPSPLDGAPDRLAGLIAFYFNKMDSWLEEDEEIFGHPRDPYHRVDVIPTSASLRFMKRGEVLAETTRAMALFETSRPTRWYLPRTDVVGELEPSDTTSICPYKGVAAYYNVRQSDGTLHKDLVWYYAEPLAEARRVAGYVCFYNERVDVELDGVAVQRPESPRSHGRAQPPQLTRG